LLCSCLYVYVVERERKRELDERVREM
jgi:hypothetical protein